MIIADTDVLIDALAGVEPAVSTVARAIRQRRLATTSITRFELLAGARTPTVRDRVVRLLRAVPPLDYDGPAADRAAGLSRELQAAGTPLAPADLAIAGICLEMGVPLLTRNHRHFGRIAGLKLAEP